MPSGVLKGERPLVLSPSKDRTELVEAPAQHFDKPSANGGGRANGVRPTWLLPEPQRLQEDAAFGRPLHQGTPLVLASRAERIESGWFDGALISRDYHVAQAKDHRWLWVFRERRGDAAHWYLHGVFG